MGATPAWQYDKADLEVTVLETAGALEALGIAGSRPDETERLTRFLASLLAAQRANAVEDRQEVLAAIIRGRL